MSVEKAKTLLENGEGHALAAAVLFDASHGYGRKIGVSKSKVGMLAVTELRFQSLRQRQGSDFRKRINKLRIAIGRAFSRQATGSWLARVSKTS